MTQTREMLNVPETPKMKTRPKPFYTGHWLKCCDRCEHAEPHYCKLYSRPMKNMDIKRCRSWQERISDRANYP